MRTAHPAHQLDAFSELFGDRRGAKHNQEPTDPLDEFWRRLMHGSRVLLLVLPEVGSFPSTHRWPGYGTLSSMDSQCWTFHQDPEPSGKQRPTLRVMMPCEDEGLWFEGSTVSYDGHFQATYCDPSDIGPRVYALGVALLD